MPTCPDQILTVAQMRAAEQALIEAGGSVEGLMDIAGKGAAEWVWRLAARRPVTVLCGPGNNGGDGYVIAETLRQRGGGVAVVASAEPRTAAAQNARALYRGEVLGRQARPAGEILVDCLFGSGLTRPLAAQDMVLLRDLAASHRHGVAVDLPSGVDSDSGAALNEGLPQNDLTIALGAWKYAHFLMPACARMGEVRLVPIGVAPVAGAARLLEAPVLRAPAADAHKYRRGLLGVVAGAMPGASLLACLAAQRAGAGYVKLLSEDRSQAVPADLVVETAPLAQALEDPRWSALLVGPGLGRGDAACARFQDALGAGKPTVVDADALPLLAAINIQSGKPFHIVATPHEGELAAMERELRLPGTGAKPDRARALAEAAGIYVVAKGPDTIVAAPDGRMALAPRASSWLSVAGTGDVLAGTIAGRLATGIDPFEAACQGVWLHAEAARSWAGPFTAGDIATAISSAYAASL